MKNKKLYNKLVTELTLFYLHSHMEYELFKSQIAFDELVEKNFPSFYEESKPITELEQTSICLELFNNLLEAQISACGQRLQKTLTTMLSMATEGQTACVGFAIHTNAPSTEADRLLNLFSQIDAPDHNQYVSRCFYRMREYSQTHFSCL